MPETVDLEKPLAIIGEEDVVLGFKALGFKVYPVKEPQEFKVTLDEVMTGKLAVCLVQDNIYRLAQGEINTYRNLALPIFIPFSKGAKTNLLDEIVKDIRLKATGTF
jgi:vacuolar-type H+-ATPase subunit F/Vma7